MSDAAISRVITDLAAIDERVRRHITELVGNQMGRWTDEGGDASVNEALTTYRAMALSGGKRLRPAFAYWAFEGVGGDLDDPAILEAAVAVELLHTFALIHDDVMDEAETRRGEETIHVTYAARHRDRGMRGDHTHYGESIAILLGDLAFAHAAQLMTRVPPACASIFFEMCADLMVGQFLDIESSARGPQRGSDVAGQITELKTARYTVEGPLLLGAAVAGRADELRPSIQAYGRPLGHAFQLRDDLLGTYGDSERTGKPVGDDLAQGKVTRLLEIGLARCDEAHHDLLERLGSPAMEPGDVERAQQVLIECGARDEIETTIGRLVEDATTAIEGAPLLPEIREVLVGAAHLIANRDH
jgi:geranylgeranyl diphosphate synthase type I